MNEIITIQGTDIKAKEYRGKRVVTFADIDRVHQRPEGTARKRFNDNRKRFISGADFFRLSKEECQLSEFRTVENMSNNGITLITESGYLMLVKSFTDDLAWRVQRELVDSYFRAKEYTTVIDTDKLIKCGEIMAGCLEGNRPYVVAILRNIFPGLDDVEAELQKQPKKEEDVTKKAPTDRKKKSVPIAGYTTCFDAKKFDRYMTDHGIGCIELAGMLGCSTRNPGKWRNGLIRPGGYYRVKICEVLELPQGYFDKKERRRRR